jgi:hypothetical protein
VSGPLFNKRILQTESRKVVCSGNTVVKFYNKPVTFLFLSEYIDSDLVSNYVRSSGSTRQLTVSCILVSFRLFFVVC